MQVQLSSLGQAEDYGDEFWDRDPSTWGSGWGDPAFDPDSCDPNASYPKGHPCDLVQKGVETGIVLERNEIAVRSRRSGAQSGGQWISGVPNVFVLTGGALVAFLLLRR